MVLCDIKNATIRNCNLYNCEVRKSSIEDSYLYGGSKVISSKVKSTVIDFGNELKDCFIDCENKNVNGKIIGGIFRAGNLGENSELSKETIKIKAPEDIRKVRFVTDSRLKDINDKFPNSRFGNMNY
jgi:hypothetical protein